MSIKAGQVHIIYISTRGPIGTSTALGAGHVVALRLSDGQILWKFPLPDAPSQPWKGGATQAVALTANFVIVASNNGRVYGVDRATGAKVWEYIGNAPFEAGVAIIRDVAVVANLNGEFIGLDIATGARRWLTTNGGSSIIEQITSDDECAYVSSGSIMCLDASGQLKWEQGGASKGGPLYFTPVRSVGRRLFAGSATGFHAIDINR